MNFKLSGFQETVLVSDSDGNLIQLRLGDKSTKSQITKLASRPVHGRWLDGKAYLLLEDGTIYAIDSALGSVVKTIKSDVVGARDIEVKSAEEAYVSSANGLLVKVNLSTGESVGTLDLRPLANPNGAVSLTEMIRFKDQLFVQVQRKNRAQRPEPGLLAVIDLSTFKLSRVVELGIAQSDSGVFIPAVNPRGLMVVDETKRQIYITAKGLRPSNTGMLLRLNIDNLTLDSWHQKADGGFQGPIARAVNGTLFVAYHTSTPVSSTHLKSTDLDVDGNPTLKTGTILDAFEELPDFPVNSSRTLLAFPMSCASGLCPGGKGISFVNMITGEAYTRLSADELGILPSFVLMQ